MKSPKKNPGKSRRYARSILAVASVAATTGLLAQAAPAAKEEAPAPAPINESDIEIVLDPFEVNAEQDVGYAATSTLAGSRINTQLKDVGSAISVITSEFLGDTGATDSKSLLQYTTNTEVGSIQGNFTNASSGNQQEEGSFTNPNNSTRVRGLTSADNTRNFFITDIPWDAYNVDRIDMQRGANSILFGMGSPAGIINTTTKSAQFRTFGEVEARYGSYDTNRFSIDYNHEILKDELAVRVDLLRNDEKYRQKPAYSLDKRVFGTARYEPKFLNSGDHKTSIKANYESGSIKSNNPRVITPIDMITPWFTELNQAGFNPNTVRDNQPRYTYDANNIVTGYSYSTEAANQKTYASHVPVGSLYSESASASGGSNSYYNPWLGNFASNYESGPMTFFNSDGSAYMTATGYGNLIGAYNSNGTTKTSLDAFSDAAYVAIAPYGTYASNAGVAFKELYKSSTLTDASIFDFYNNLIDGDTKREWQNFHNFSATLSQHFFNNLFGFELAHDRSVYRRGQFSMVSDQRAGVAVDINEFNVDGSPNANFGRAYFADSGIYANNDIESNREASRASVYLDYNFAKGRKGWFPKLLGRHVLSGLVSEDMVETDTRNFMRWGTGSDMAILTDPTPDDSPMKGNRRIVHPVVYLSDSLVGKSLTDDLAIHGAGDALDIPTSVPYSYFNATWTNTNVALDDRWINPRTNMISTQSQNPDNYVGWTTTNVQVLSAEDGFDVQDKLTYDATLLKKKSNSQAAVLQSYFWNGAIVGMYGIRHDSVKSWGAGAATFVDGRVNFNAVDSKGNRIYSYEGREASKMSKNSPSWSVVGHLNKLLGKWGDSIPLNVSLYYNKSENFQVIGTRYDMYGKEIPAASGETTDRGIMISTKDDRFSLRINKYESTVKDASSTAGLNPWLVGNNGDATIFAWGETWADVYEHKLGNAGDPSSADSVSKSWNWMYVPENSSMTPAQADALRLSAVADWRKFTSNPKIQQVLKAFNYNDFNGVSAINKAGGLPNFSMTEDQVSKGYEFELTANPTKNWRISFNASKTQAMRNNVGGTALNEVVEIMNDAFNHTDAGQIRLWGGNNLNNKVVNQFNSQFYNNYVLMKLQEGTFSPELRKWRYNVVTNYTFSEGRLKGFNVGGGYRWQDKVAIGYPVLAAAGSTGVYTYDIANPIMGPSEDGIDFWIGYEKKLNDKIDWRIQFNIRNLGKSKDLIPLTVQPTTDPSKYTVAAWRIAPGQTWEITNTFKF
ncbi:MAG TPA: TonB-dependent receptor plug domain-containing protein [Opitutaceae bacterium]|nr:TonB-dependent receptor plug domain-containing protein [Opitutaceae bacterium]